MTIRDELDDARSEGYNAGFETGFNFAIRVIKTILENNLDLTEGSMPEVLAQIDQLSP